MNHAENLNVSSNNAQPLPHPNNAELPPSPFPASPPLPPQTHTTHPVSDIQLLFLAAFLRCFAQISHHVFVRERSAYSRLLVPASSCSLLRFRCDGLLFVEQHVLLQHRYTGRFTAGSLQHELNSIHTKRKRNHFKNVQMFCLIPLKLSPRKFHYETHFLIEIVFSFVRCSHCNSTIVNKRTLMGES